jgi:hypothetical protein
MRNHMAYLVHEDFLLSPIFQLDCKEVALVFC